MEVKDFSGWQQRLQSYGCARFWKWLTPTVGAKRISLRVRQLDLSARTIRLDVGTTKNDEGREVTMSDAVHTLLQQCG